MDGPVGHGRLRAWREPGALVLVALLLAAASGAAACRRSRPILSRGDAAVVLLTPPVPIPPGLQAVPEREPASASEGPMPLVLAGTPGLAVVGALNEGGPAPDDEDLFALEMPGGSLPQAEQPAGTDAGTRSDGGLAASRVLTVEVTPAATLATILEVRDAAGVVLGQSSGAAGQRHGLPNVAVQPGGRYLLTVRRDRARKTTPPPAATQPSGSYALVVRETSLGAGDEREPNDSPESATSFGPAHVSPEMAGYLGTPSDRDFYRIPVGEASEATVISIFLSPPSSLGASLTVFDRSGVKLQSARGPRRRTGGPPGPGGVRPEPGPGGRRTRLLLRRRAGRGRGRSRTSVRPRRPVRTVPGRRT